MPAGFMPFFIHFLFFILKKSSKMMIERILLSLNQHSRICGDEKHKGLVLQLKLPLLRLLRG